MDLITRKEDYCYHLGKLYFQKKEYLRALNELKKGLKINADSIIILYELARCYMKLENYQKSIKLFQRVQKITPFSMLAINSLEKIIKLKS